MVVITESELVPRSQLGVSRFSFRICADSSVVTPGRAPASTSLLRIYRRSVSALAIPSLAATDRIAAYSDS